MHCCVYTILITVILNFFQCLCHSCHSSPEHNNNHTGINVIKLTGLMGLTIKNGSRIRCYYRTAGGTYLLMWKTSNAIVLHAILWPTLLFIAGFVSLFFSCIALQKDRYFYKHARKRKANTSIEL